MKLGDKVTWTSQAGSTERTKIGEIIEVVPENKYPLKKKGDIGMPRNHESYVVRAYPVIKNKPKKNTKLYWPRASQLKLHKKP